MPKVARIHADKSPPRRHYLQEWLDERGIDPMDLVAGLNHPDRPMELNEIDKSQVYRWLGGQMPQKRTIPRIALALGFDDPNELFRHPIDGWFSRFIEGRNEEERERIRRQLDLIKQQLELAFPREGKRRA